MSVVSLRVLISGVPAGVLMQDASGVAKFRYDAAYSGTPLSITMPISNRVYGPEVVRPYLFGLLPDNEEQRSAIAREFGIRPNNPVSLLSHIGLDCPGAVQFCAPELVDEVLNRPERHRALSDHEIARRLKAIRSDDATSWMGRDESWSLGGNQGKFALALIGGTWQECLGSAATTHIFKNGVVGFKLEALNEFICMKTAERIGIPTAHVSYRFFEDEPALIVERYDREEQPTGHIVRLHQEDFCQALGVMPYLKYASDGGPTTHDVLAMLQETDYAAVNVYGFTQMLFYNYLIGAPDAHAKNYSLFLGPEGSALLARMYDVASGLAYEGMRRHGRLAMSIGGENRFGRVGLGALRRYAEVAGLDKLGFDEHACLELMRGLAETIPQCMAEVFDEAEAQHIKGADDLRYHMEGAIKENCRTTLVQLR